jgi:RNA polymerase sigma-70 factor, ECF subfamily
MALPVVSRENSVLANARSGEAPESRIRHGDEHAFGQLFLQHYPSLCEFVNSMVRAPDDAEEIVQGVFHRIWEARATWNPKGGARAYLFAACRNHAVDFLRHEQVVTRAASDASREIGGRTTASQSRVARAADADLEAAELQRRLRDAVDALPERRRLVVILRWQHQLSNPEIAQVLGISVKGVEIQFSRALADLRRRLEGARLLDLM